MGRIRYTGVVRGLPATKFTMRMRHYVVPLCLLLAACSRACEKQSSGSAQVDVPPIGPVAEAPGSESAVRQALKAAGLDATNLTRSQKLEPGLAYLMNFEGQAAIDAWHKARRTLPAVGYWPVVMAAGKDSQYICALEWFRTPSSDLVKQAERLVPAEWFSKRTSEEPEAFQVDTGTWPDKPSTMTQYTIPFDILSGKPRSTWLALIPTGHSWQVPAVCKWGGAEMNPDPSVHAGLLKHWKAQYGAELVGMSDAVIEMSVARPPTTKAQARALAREQFLYCPDLVLQGVGSLEALAAALLNGKIWYFWWD